MQTQLVNLRKSTPSFSSSENWNPRKHWQQVHVGLSLVGGLDVSRVELLIGRSWSARSLRDVPDESLILWALKISLFEWVLRSENQEQEMLLGVFNDVCESVIIKSLNLRKVGGAEIDELSVLEGFDESVGGAEINELSVLGGLDGSVDEVGIDGFSVLGGLGGVVVDDLVQVALGVLGDLDFTVHARQRHRVHQRVQSGAGEGIEGHFGSITAAMSIALQR